MMSITKRTKFHNDESIKITFKWCNAVNGDFLL